MENGTLMKLGLAIVAVVVLCVIAGALIPGSPIKAIADQASGGLNPGAGPTAIPGTGTPKPAGNPGGQDSSASTNVGMAGAMELARSNDQAKTWFSDHAGWGLVRAETGHMDVQGNAAEWTLTYVDGLYVMIVQTKNDRFLSCNTYNSSAAVMYGMDPKGFVDTPVVMGTLLAHCPGLSIEQGSMPFAVTLNAGPDPAYTVEYGGDSRQPGFKATINARNGELLESTFRSVTD